MTPNNTMKTYQITIADIIIDVVRKDIKNLHLAVYPPDGRVRIATPLHINDESVRLFAISKLAWIKKNQTKFQLKPRPETIEYLSGENHYFQGKPYTLNVIYQNHPKVEIRNNQYLDLSVKPGSDKEQRQKVLNSWYRQQLKAQIPPLIDKWEKVINVNINEWGIKIMRTKWGTCNIQAKRIWLNLELAKKNPLCLEYVIVHEITHLLERSHGAKFQALMDKFMPKWREYKAELNR
ncbi:MULTISPECIES: M48 family metallopeptidase [unclassified Anabaena]|uniref:M48 family metallopeptidase n=1 Tax=unclassified Anabaena TaxID=2619674 RepID=UPI001446EF94|nr:MULTISPECIES: SprT family zinc-dependent metalloprotease [unclassified Anabaena]MTJ09433.1 M48 family metallopeptidase [Anabaena sp. UHCC 0204]MTJ55380.1 M48 family metallopeptidase [Anabaena sp. UHCC 0253]